MPENSESDNPAWKLKMAHNFLLRSIFSDGYREIGIKEIAEETLANSESDDGKKVVTEQDSPVKKVDSGYSNPCLTFFLLQIISIRPVLKRIKTFDEDRLL